MKRILIAYATETGSTAEVAKSVAETLSSKGFGVDVKHVGEVDRLDGYDGVVVGSPIQGMRWRPDAVAFVERHRAELKKTPTALFLLSVALSGGSEFWKGKVRQSLDGISAGLNIVSRGFFAGKIRQDPPFILRLVFSLKKGMDKDARDWGAIKAWAEDLATKL